MAKHNATMENADEKGLPLILISSTKTTVACRVKHHRALQMTVIKIECYSPARNLLKDLGLKDFQNWEEKKNADLKKRLIWLKDNELLLCLRSLQKEGNNFRQPHFFKDSLRLASLGSTQQQTFRQINKTTCQQQINTSGDSTVP